MLRTPLATRISRLGLSGILLIYLAALAVSAVAGGLVFHATGVGGPDESLKSSIFSALSMALGARDPHQGGDLDLAGVTGVVLAVIGVILPAWLLGAFVYLVFKFDPIVWKKTASYENPGNGRAHVTFRFYNGSSETISGMKVKVTARYTTDDRPATRAVEPMKLNTGMNRPLQDCIEWPISDPAMAQSVRMPLAEVDGCVGVEFARLDRLIPHEKVEYVVEVSGMLTGTGNEIRSQHLYRADEVIEGHFQEIDIDVSVPPREWSGWQGWENNVHLFVFGYGSLLNSQSASRTLGDAEALTYANAVLAGYELAWNAGLVTGAAEGVDGIAVALGLEESPEGRCEGSVIAITRDDLVRLDNREINYARVDVTETITWEGAPEHRTVVTYVPLADSVAGSRSPEAFVSQAYASSVADGYAEQGLDTAQLTAATSRAGLPIRTV